MSSTCCQTQVSTDNTIRNKICIAHVSFDRRTISESLSFSVRNEIKNVESSSLKYGEIRVSLFLVGINEKIVGGICKVVSITLHRYKETTSQAYVKNLIIALLKKQPEATVRFMTSAISEQATWHKGLVPT